MPQFHENLDRLVPPAPRPFALTRDPIRSRGSTGDEARKNGGRSQIPEPPPTPEPDVPAEPESPDEGEWFPRPRHVPNREDPGW